MFGKRKIQFFMQDKVINVLIYCKIGHFEIAGLFATIKDLFQHYQQHPFIRMGTQSQTSVDMYQNVIDIFFPLNYVRKFPFHL